MVCVFVVYSCTFSSIHEEQGTYWDSVDPSFMLEESAHESEGELLMHRHTPVYRVFLIFIFQCFYSCILSRSQKLR